MLKAHFLSAAVVGSFALFALTTPPTDPVASDLECTLSFDPSSVTAGGETTQVRLIPSEEVEGVDAASVADDSRLVVSFNPARPLLLTVNPAEARVGSWNVTLHAGETAVCTGALTVEEPAVR